jgi:hypothetical protein
MRLSGLLAVLLVLVRAPLPASAGDPPPAVAGGLRLCERNTRYLCFRGRPTLLVGSGEHYGAVVNLDFEYRKYLDTVKRDGQNLVRVWSGAYREHPGSFGIPMNTLDPAPGRFLPPWARSGVPGYAAGGAKFDLERWDEAYFARLRDFVAEAGRRDIVVEYTFFCTFFHLVDPEAWAVSPMNARNNVNGIGDVPGARAYDLGNAALTRVQKGLVRKVVGELRDADNVYFEVVNEGYHWFGPVARDWQDEMLRTADDARRETGSRALLAENVAQGRRHVTRLAPATSILNFHYASPPYVVEDNLGLGRPLAFDEDGFDQPGDWTYRENAWEFLMAGGAVYDNLDYSFTVGHEDGTAVQEKAPGWGGATFRRQLRVLKEFLESFDLPALAPRTSLVVGGAANAAEVTQEGTARAWALADEGRAYAVYLTRLRIAKALLFDIAPGAYRVEWLDPRTGARRDGGTVEREPGALLELPIPEYEEDLALALRRVEGESDPRSLVVDGNLLKLDGRRWIARGTNVYVQEDGDRATVDGIWRNREAMYDRMVSLGINAVRLSYWTSVDPARVRDHVASATARGLHVLLCPHDVTGRTGADLLGMIDAGRRTTTVLYGTPGIGDNPLVYFEPWNEPGPGPWPEWRAFMEASVSHLRGLGYRRPIVVDTPGWSWTFSPEDADRMIAFDAALLGGKAQVVFANHRYPRPHQPADVSYDREHRAEHDETVLRHVGTYPILATEHGWNVDDPPQDCERWLRELLRHLVASAIPAGHNGVFAWMWCWDPNGQVEGPADARAITTLSAYGRLWNDEYYSRMTTGAPVSRSAR